MLNKVKLGSNMYAFLNDYPYKNANRGYTINFAKGRCEYKCDYCYYQNNPRFKPKIGKLRLDEKEFKTNLGKGNFIFVGSSIDMWGNDISILWINRILEHCAKFDNKYLFQTKNPWRFELFIEELFKVSDKNASEKIAVGNHPDTKNIMLGITLESNKDHKVSKAPTPLERIEQFQCMVDEFPIMISLEPIMDFDLKSFVYYIKSLKPEFVSIGADSKKYIKLPEPSPEKLKVLIKELKKFTNVKIKPNLLRILNKNE